MFLRDRTFPPDRRFQILMVVSKFLKDNSDRHLNYGLRELEIAQETMLEFATQI